MLLKVRILEIWDGIQCSDNECGLISGSSSLVWLKLIVNYELPEYVYI